MTRERRLGWESCCLLNTPPLPLSLIAKQRGLLTPRPCFLPHSSTGRDNWPHRRIFWFQNTSHGNYRAHLLVKWSSGTSSWWFCLNGFAVIKIWWVRKWTFLCRKGNSLKSPGRLQTSVSFYSKRQSRDIAAKGRKLSRVVTMSSQKRHVLLGKGWKLVSGSSKRTVGEGVYASISVHSSSFKLFLTQI